jgi:hypothetical protein
MGRYNHGTKMLGWQLTDEPYKSNVEVYRRQRGTLSIMVSNGGYGCVMQLTPQQAREFAITVMDVADIVEKEEN